MKLLSTSSKRLSLWFIKGHISVRFTVLCIKNWSTYMYFAVVEVIKVINSATQPGMRHSHTYLRMSILRLTLLFKWSWMYLFLGYFSFNLWAFLFTKHELLYLIDHEKIVEQAILFLMNEHLWNHFSCLVWNASEHWWCFLMNFVLRKQQKF